MKIELMWVFVASVCTQSRRLEHAAVPQLLRGGSRRGSPRPLLSQHPFQLRLPPPFHTFLLYHYSRLLLQTLVEGEKEGGAEQNPAQGLSDSISLGNPTQLDLSYISGISS